MTLFFMDRELMALMQDFHTLTGIRIALFDRDMAELMSYPNDRKTFCMHMREDPDFDAKCRACDERACALCRSENQLQIYRCHAGLTEAIAPITQDGRNIGYMMFGQVTEDADREEFFERMRALCESYDGSHDRSKSIRRIKHRTRKQILAAARILDAFTDYILLKEMIRLSPEELFDGIKRYATADDMIADKAANNNYDSFSATYWDTTIGMPVWKNVEVVLCDKNGNEVGNTLELTNGASVELVAYSNGVVCDQPIVEIKENGGNVSVEGAKITVVGEGQSTLTVKYAVYGKAYEKEI